MKKNYTCPFVCVETFSQEEILTDLISVSATRQSENISWEDFINIYDN